MCVPHCVLMHEPYQLKITLSREGFCPLESPQLRMDPSAGPADHSEMTLPFGRVLQESRLAPQTLLLGRLSWQEAHTVLSVDHKQR